LCELWLCLVANIDANQCPENSLLQDYKCIGSDSWRKLGGPVCDNNHFIRQELLDQIVWAEVVRLLEDPALIQQELDRRLAAARTSDPTRKREQNLRRELSQVDKGIERLLTAYQEELLSLEQLRERTPMLRQRQQAKKSFDCWLKKFWLARISVLAISPHDRVFVLTGAGVSAKSGIPTFHPFRCVAGILYFARSGG
jgi:hypothetical protein